MKTLTQLPTPRIYVRCLAAYNSGTLHGTWIDADQDAEAIREEVRAMLAASPVEDAEEWAIHDYEGFGSITLSESESFERVSELAAFIDEHERTGLALLEHFGGDFDEAKQAINNYVGTYRNLAEYAEEMMEGYEIPDAIAPYVDYDRMAKDWEMSGDIFTIEPSYDEVLVFTSRSIPAVNPFSNKPHLKTGLSFWGNWAFGPSLAKRPWRGMLGSNVQEAISSKIAPKSPKSQIGRVATEPNG